MDARDAVKLDLPTRHVTMRTGGGLSFASHAYYNWFVKVEDRFFCTVRFNAAHALMHVHLLIIHETHDTTGNNASEL